MIKINNRMLFRIFLNIDHLSKKQLKNLTQKAYAKDLLCIIIRKELKSFRRSLDSLNSNDDPEIVHQLRVSSRKLRCAIGFLRKLNHDNDLKYFINFARDIANLFSSVRELDVFKEFILANFKKTDGNDNKLNLLLNKIDDLRTNEFSASLSKLRNIPIMHFSSKLENYFQINNYDNLKLRSKKYSVKVFTKQILTKLYNTSINFKLNKTYITDTKLHDLRISLKKLRYASEFFGNFYKHKKNKKFISLLSQCQDLLGLKNDALATKKILTKLGFGISNEHQIFSNQILNYNNQQVHDQDLNIFLMWKRLKKVDLFWR